MTTREIPASSLQQWFALLRTFVFAPGAAQRRAVRLEAQRAVAAGGV